MMNQIKGKKSKSCRPVTADKNANARSASENNAEDGTLKNMTLEKLTEMIISKAENGIIDQLISNTYKESTCPEMKDDQCQKYFEAQLPTLSFNDVDIPIEEFVDIYPNAFEFYGPFSGNCICQLIIRNITDSLVAFRLTSPRPKLIIVNISKGIIYPNQKSTILINFKYNGESPEEDLGSDEIDALTLEICKVQTISNCGNINSEIFRVSFNMKGTFLVNADDELRCLMEKQKELQAEYKKINMLRGVLMLFVLLLGLLAIFLMYLWMALTANKRSKEKPKNNGTQNSANKKGAPSKK